MTHAVRNCALAFCLAVGSTGLAFTQTSTSAATVSAADVAQVYVGTHQGVYLYHASSTGALSLVTGSPFHPSGLAIGSNGKYFLSLGTDYVHSYSVASNGAIGQQKSQINTQNYYGADCGSTTAAVLDHTGQNLYVQLNQTEGGPGVCVAYQTYDIAKASGALTSNGAAVYDSEFPWQGGGFFAFAITGNNRFAYATNSFNQYVPSLSAFRRASSGALEYTNFSETDPPSSGNVFNLTGDPTNHLAMARLTAGGGYLVLASYTVDDQGNIASTNTANNLPRTQIFPTSIRMSPSGKLLAIASDFQSPSVQVFHFNGANPITPYSTLPVTDFIYQIQWDNNDHLYALSDSANKLYVYTVTPTSIKQAPGSPYTIRGGANALVVVSNLCSAPASAGVTICVPASGSTVSSPVQVQAAAKVTGTIASMQLWVDGAKKYTAASSATLTTSVSLTAGTHRFAVIAVNTAGQKWENAVNAVVK